jgi:hypothetical protein
LKQRFLSLDVSFRYIIRSSQKDSCWGRGFKFYHQFTLITLINYSIELSSIVSSCQTKFSQ